MAATFITAQTWKQPRCPSVGQWMNKLWSIRTLGCHSTLKRSELSSQGKTGRNLKCVLLFSRWIMQESLWPHGLWPTRLLCPWGFPGKNTGVGCHALLQGVFPSQGVKATSPALQMNSLRLSRWESPAHCSWLPSMSLIPSEWNFAPFSHLHYLLWLFVPSHPICIFVRTSLCLLHAMQWFLQGNPEKFYKESRWGHYSSKKDTFSHPLPASEASRKWWSIKRVPFSSVTI